MCEGEFVCQMYSLYRLWLFREWSLRGSDASSAERIYLLINLECGPIYILGRVVSIANVRVLGDQVSASEGVGV